LLSSFLFLLFVFLKTFKELAVGGVPKAEECVLKARLQFMFGHVLTNDVCFLFFYFSYMSLPEILPNNVLLLFFPR
jgi:hypothetical protein